MLEEGFFTKLCTLYLLFQNLEAQCASVHHFSRRLGRRRHQQFHFLWLHHGQNFIVNRNSDSSFFLLLSNRIDDTNSPLLRKYWADSQNELLETKVLFSSNFHWKVWHFYFSSASRFHDSKALILLNTGWPVSLNRCIILLAVESHSSVFGRKKNFHSTSLPTLDPRMSNCPCENFIA